MSELFLSVLNMSLTASYVIIFVILIRLLLKKAPKFVSYALWGVVAFRLMIPFSFESMFSLMPRSTNTVPIPHDIVYQQSPQVNSGIGVVDSLVNNSLPAPTIVASVNPLKIYVEIGAYIWVLGIIALLVYSLVSILILKRQLKSAQLIEKNIFEAKNLKTPFVLGLIKPKIYLPVGLNATERSYILLHEQTHIQRKDHIIKVLAFLTLSVYWFNPLVWIAFMLMSKDMELSCDERVLKQMNNEDIKKPYASSLLSLASGKHILNGSPLAFGEGNVKGRIKNVLNYKKPGTWVIAVSVVITAVLGFGLAVNRATDGIGDYDFYNFSVNGFMLGADTKKMDTSTLTPTEPLNVKDGYDFNFEEIRYSADEETGRLRKMIVNVYDNGVMSMLVAHANGKDNVSLDNQTYQIEGIEAILGKGKTGWHDREQRLRYTEYRHQEGRLSATVRFVYTDGRSEDGLMHRLIWVIAESSLPYTYPYPDENIYPLEFSQISYTKIQNLQSDNINIIAEKIIDKDLSAFIFTNNENGEYKGAINSHGKSYYIGQVSIESTPEGLMGIEELQIFGKRAVKFYGILGANYAQAYYWLVEEKTEDSIFQVGGNTIEIDLDNDGKTEVVATTGTIPETRIYMLKKGKIVVSDINKSIGAESVSLYDESKGLFEVYFEPNKPEQYVFNKDSLIRK